MPTYQRLGADDGENLKDRWEPAIELDEEPPVAVRKPGPPLQLASQDGQLMSEHRILRLKPAVCTENLKLGSIGSEVRQGGRLKL